MLMGMFSKDLWQMLCRSQMVSGRGGMAHSREGTTRAQASHPPWLCFCSGCVFGIAVNTSLSVCSPKPLGSQCPLWAPGAVMRQALLLCWHQRGLQRMTGQKNYENLVAWTFSEVLHLFLHSSRTSKACPKWDNSLPDFLLTPFIFLRTLITLMLSLSRARWVMCCLKAML